MASSLSAERNAPRLNTFQLHYLHQVVPKYQTGPSFKAYDESLEAAYAWLYNFEDALKTNADAALLAKTPGKKTKKTATAGLASTIDLPAPSHIRSPVTLSPAAPSPAAPSPTAPSPTHSSPVAATVEPKELPRPSRPVRSSWLRSALGATVGAPGGSSSLPLHPATTPFKRAALSPPPAAESGEDGMARIKKAMEELSARTRGRATGLLLEEELKEQREREEQAAAAEAAKREEEEQREREAAEAEAAAEAARKEEQRLQREAAEAAEAAEVARREEAARREREAAEAAAVEAAKREEEAARREEEARREREAAAAAAAALRKEEERRKREAAAAAEAAKLKEKERREREAAAAAEAARKEQELKERRAAVNKLAEANRLRAAAQKAAEEKAKEEEAAQKKMAELKERKARAADLERRRKEREAKEKAKREEQAAAKLAEEESKKRKMAPTPSTAPQPKRLQSIAGPSSVKIPTGKIATKTGIPPSSSGKTAAPSFNQLPPAPKAASSTIRLVGSSVGTSIRTSQAQGAQVLQAQRQALQTQILSKSQGYQSPRAERPGESEAIELADIDSEYSDSEDEDRPRSGKDAPAWAQSPEIRNALKKQEVHNPDEIFGRMKPLSMDEVFRARAGKFRARTSSANWTNDGVTPQEEILYSKRMGWDK